MLNPSPLSKTVWALGLAALGRPGYINVGHAEDVSAVRDRDALERHTHHMLDAAWEAGIRHFDCARSYGLAEAFLGTWLRSRNLPADAVSVSSKWGYTYTANWRVDAPHHEIKEHSRAMLDAQWPESRAHLHPWLSLYQIHSATLESGVLENQSVLERLAQIREEGIQLGLSTSGPRQADVIYKALDTRATDGSCLFHAVQATFNLLEPSAGPALAEASRAGLRILAKETLANGRLSPRGMGPAVERCASIGESFGVGPDAVALAWIMHQPWADMILSGAASPEHLHSHLAASRVTAEQIEELNAETLAEPPEVYWQKRAALPWN